VLGLCKTFAQPDKKLDSLVSDYINGLTELWNKNRGINFSSLLETEDPFTKQFYSLTSSSPLAAKNSLQNELLIKRNKLQQRIYKKDVGLSLGGAYQENLGTPFVSPDEAVVFRRKFQVGLEWDILKGGLFDNRNKIKALQNDIVFLESGNSKSFNPQQSSLQYYTRIIAWFNIHKIAILNTRKELINSQNQIAKVLWELKQLTGDAYLKSEQHKTHINTQYKLYNSYNEDSKKIRGNDSVIFTPNLFDLDFGKIITHIDSLKIRSDSFVVYEKPHPGLNNYYNEMSLKAYTRYNYYDVFNNASVNRNFISFGLNLSAPLTFNSKEKNEIDDINYKLKFFQYNNASATNESMNTEYFILNLLYEYRYKLNQYFTLLEKRKLFEELLRTEKVKQKMGDVEFNPNTAIYILDDYWANAIEIMDLHQQLYGTLLNICEKVPTLNINSVIKPINKSDYIGITAANPSKSIYIWSKSFKEHGAAFISDYVKLNSFTDLLISYRSDKNYVSELNDFINNSGAYKIHLMIGQNKLLGYSMQPLLDSMKANISPAKIHGIHLDIEPHTMADFKENKEEYFTKYLTLLNESEKFARANNLKLSVSIPLNYPENILNNIFSKCDRVYLMAYENVSPDFIAKKTEEEKQTGKSKIILALRAKDFETRDGMEKLFSGLGITNIAYHDLESMYELDKKSIQVKEEKDKKEKKDK